MRRRRALLVLAAMALLVVPAAVSWACGPNRGVQLNRFDYLPEQTVIVSGANWIEGVGVTVTLNGTPVATATTSTTGNFSASFAAPSTPGTYTVVADGEDPNTGQSLPGGNTRQTFTVTAPKTAPPAAPAPTRGNAPTTPGTSTGTTSGGGGDRGGSGDNSRTVGSGERRRTAGGGRSGAPAGGGRAGSGAGSGTGSGPVNTTEGLIKSAGTTAFAGSVTRRSRAGASERRGPQSQKAARPSERSAGADLWSGLASSKNPSLMPDAGDNGVPATAKGSGFALALGLLGAGLLGLLGLGLAEAQRRRSKATASSQDH